MPNGKGIVEFANEDGSKTRLYDIDSDDKADIQVDEITEKNITHSSTKKTYKILNENEASFSIKSEKGFLGAGKNIEIDSNNDGKNEIFYHKGNILGSNNSTLNIDINSDGASDISYKNSSSLNYNGASLEINQNGAGSPNDAGKGNEIIYLANDYIKTNDFIEDSKTDLYSETTKKNNIKIFYNEDK